MSSVGTNACSKLIRPLISHDRWVQANYRERQWLPGSFQEKHLFTSRTSEHQFQQVVAESLQIFVRLSQHERRTAHLQAFSSFSSEIGSSLHGRGLVIDMTKFSLGSATPKLPRTLKEWRLFALCIMTTNKWRTLTFTSPPSPTYTNALEVQRSCRPKMGLKHAEWAVIILSMMGLSSFPAFMLGGSSRLLHDNR